MAEKVTTIRQKVLISAKAIDVYNAFADPEQHASFTGTRVTGEARPGQEFTALNGYVSGIYLEVEEGKRIVEQWQTDKWPPGYGPSVLELQFEDHENGTEITLTQSPVPGDYADLLAQGWTDFYWTPLQAWFQKKDSGNEHGGSADALEAA